MSFKNILCAYSGEKAQGSGLSHAVKLAKHYDGWLTGIMRHGRPTLERRYAAHIPDDVLKQLRAADDARIEEVSTRFAKTVQQAGLAERSEFIERMPGPDRALSDYARNFDLIVTGVHSDSLSDTHLSANPDLIALHSGRPVVVVPDGYTAHGLANHALVAWDGKRSAARALSDAMGAIEEKGRVTVITIGREDAPDIDVLLRNLARHTVEVDYRLQPRSGSIAQSILRAAEDAKAQLLVMGAFEHSRFSHAVKGGPTTEIMARSDIPLFLSH